MDSFLSNKGSGKKSGQGQHGRAERDGPDPRTGHSGSGPAQTRKQRSHQAPSKSPMLPQQQPVQPEYQPHTQGKQSEGWPALPGASMGLLPASHINNNQQGHPQAQLGVLSGSSHDLQSQQHRLHQQQIQSLLSQYQRQTHNPQQPQQIIIVQQTAGSSHAGGGTAGPSASIQGQPVSIGSLTPSSIQSMVSGGQALSLSGLSAQQLGAILQAYGVFGGPGGGGGGSMHGTPVSNSIQSATEHTSGGLATQDTTNASAGANIIVVSTNNASGSVAHAGAGTAGLSQLTSHSSGTGSLAEQIQKLQVQNQLMQQQILANVTAGLGTQASPEHDLAHSTNFQFQADGPASSPQKLPLSEHDLTLLQNLRTHQLHQQQKQQLQQAQINMLQRQINMMKTAGGGTAANSANYDHRLSQAQAINHQLQQELLHGNPSASGAGALAQQHLEAAGASGGKTASPGDHQSAFHGGSWMQGVLNQASDGGPLGESSQANSSHSNSKRNVAQRSRMNFDPNQIHSRAIPHHQAEDESSATKQALTSSVATGVGASGTQLAQRHSSAQPHHYQNAGSSKQVKKKKSTHHEQVLSSAPHTTEHDGKPSTSKKSTKKPKDEGGSQAHDQKPAGGGGAPGPYQTQQTSKKKAVGIQSNAGPGSQSDKSNAALRAQYQSATQRQKSQLDSAASQSHYANQGAMNQIKNSHSPAFASRANKTQSNFHSTHGKELNKEDNEKGKANQGKSKSKKNKKMHLAMAEAENEKGAKPQQAPQPSSTSKNSQAGSGLPGAGGGTRPSVGGNTNSNHHRNESGVSQTPAKNTKGQDRNQEVLQLPPAGPPAPVLTAKERKKLKLEAEKEREKELFELNFQASSLYISKMQLHLQKSFVGRPNAIIVYDQNRLVKLDITHSVNFQISAVPQSATPSVAGPQKPLLITPEELHDFYNHSILRNYANVGRALEVVEEPRYIFEKDQQTINIKQHSIQERKIKEVLEQQLKEKAQSTDPKTLEKNPIIFPSANIKESTIFFNSRFESGNLREAEKLNEFEYNLYVNFDFNSSTHSQWYYFSVRNIGKGKQYKFNIMNLQKDESCYQIGMKPFVYSYKRNKENGTNLWKRGCENVCYYKNKLRTKVRECAPDYEFDEDNIPCYEYEDIQSQLVTLNTLSFCYEFEYENDITYFAYFQPYTLQDLEDYLFLIQKKYESEHLHNIYKCEKLCDTCGGNPCYVLTITDNVQEDDIVAQEAQKKIDGTEPPNLDGANAGKGGKDGQATGTGAGAAGHAGSKDFGSAGSGGGTGGASSRAPHRGDGGGDDDGNDHSLLSGFQIAARNNKDFDPYNHQKQTIFLTARVHPGESNASFMIQGAIDFLLQQNNKEAKLLRETFIFKIIPMLNPDGVVSGHYRCNYVGADLNRRWPNPSKLLHPTIYYTKKLLKMCHLDNQVLLFCDFHGHTRKRNVFMYGCVSPQTEINQHKNNNLIRIVPYLLDQKNKLFSFADCKFANEKEKESTGRLVMFKEFGILNSYTLESTFYSYYNPRMGRGKKVNVDDDLQVKVEELVEIGWDFCETLTAIINSKILKRKFIMDTTTPLGASQPGAGGNPLTQFLLNQQQELELKKHAEKNSSMYNQQNNVQSVIKSFINGPASAAPYHLMGPPNQLTNMVGGLQERPQNSNKPTAGENAGGTNITEKKKLKKLTGEQIARASDLNPQQPPQPQLKAVNALSKQQTHHSHQKSHQLSNLSSNFMVPAEQRLQASSEQKATRASAKNLSTQQEDADKDGEATAKERAVASYQTQQQFAAQDPPFGNLRDEQSHEAKGLHGDRERAEADDLGGVDQREGDGLRGQGHGRQAYVRAAGRRPGIQEDLHAAQDGLEGQEAVVGSQSIPVQAQPDRAGIEGTSSSMPGLTAQSGDATKPLFGAASAEKQRISKEEQASSKISELGLREPPSRPINSQRSLRTVDESKSNKDGPKRIDEFLPRQSTEKPKLAMRRFEPQLQSDGQAAPSSTLRARQAVQAEQMQVPQSSGADSAEDQSDATKVLATTAQMIRTGQVQLLDKDDVEGTHAQQEDEQLLSPHMRHQFGAYKAASLAGKPDALAYSKPLLDGMNSLNPEGHESQEAKDQSRSRANDVVRCSLPGVVDRLPDPGAAPAGIRYRGGLGWGGASEQGVSEIGIAPLQGSSSAINEAQSVSSPQQNALDKLRGGGTEQSDTPIFTEAGSQQFTQAPPLCPGLAQLGNNSTSLTAHHPATQSNELQAVGQQYSRASQLEHPGPSGVKGGIASISAKGPALDVGEREIFGINAAVARSQVVTEAGKAQASVVPGKYEMGRPHADADFLVGPEQLNIIDQYMNQPSDPRRSEQFPSHSNSFVNHGDVRNDGSDRAAMAGAEDPGATVSKGNVARQLLKKAQTSSLDHHQPTGTDTAIAVHDQKNVKSQERQADGGPNTSVMILEHRSHFFGGAFDPARQAAIEASKQSAASQVYSNQHQTDGFVTNYSHYSHFQHGSSGDPASIKNIRNMMKTSSGTAAAHNQANNQQLIADAKEQLFLHASNFNNHGSHKKQVVGRLEQMAQTHGTKFGGTGQRHKEGGIGTEEVALYQDHAYTEPSSGATYGKEPNAPHSTKGSIVAAGAGGGTRQQQQLGTPSAAPRHQASANSSSLDNNTSYLGLREQKSKSSLSLMKRNTSNSQQKGQAPGPQAQNGTGGHAQGSLSSPVKGACHSGAKEPPSGSSHLSEMTPLLPGQRLDFVAQTQKVKAGMGGKQSLLKSAPVSEQQDDHRQHQQMFQNFCLPPTTAGLSGQGQDQAAAYMLEKQQRLQQRKQQAELQIIQISQNIKNARQSYQSSNTVAHQTQQTLDGPGMSQHHALMAGATASSNQYQHMSSFKRKYGKGAANTMTMASGERARETQTTPYVKAPDPAQSATTELHTLKKKPSTSGNQQVASLNANSLGHNGGNSSVLPKITKDGGSRLHQNLASQGPQQRGNQSSFPHRSIMKTSVAAAHISPQKYPPQAQFTHEIVPSQAPTFHQLTSANAKQANAIDLQALSAGPALSAATSKNASNKHAASHLRAMNHPRISKAVGGSEHAEYPQTLPQQAASATLKHGAQSLGASPALGPNNGMRAMKKQNHNQANKLAGRGASKAGPADPSHPRQLDLATLAPSQHQLGAGMKAAAGLVGAFESQSSSGVNPRNSASLASGGAKDAHALRSMSGHKRASARGHTHGLEKHNQGVFMNTTAPVGNSQKRIRKELGEDAGDVALRLQLQQDEAQLPTNLNLEQITQSPGTGSKAIVIDASKIIMHVKNKEVRQGSAHGGDQLEGGAISSSEQDQGSGGAARAGTIDRQAPRTEHKQHVEVVLKLQLEVNNGR